MVTVLNVLEGEETENIILGGDLLSWPLSFGLFKWFLCRILHSQKFLAFAARDSNSSKEKNFSLLYLGCETLAMRMCAFLFSCVCLKNLDRTSHN